MMPSASDFVCCHMAYFCMMLRGCSRDLLQASLMVGGAAITIVGLTLLNAASKGTFSPLTEQSAIEALE